MSGPVALKQLSASGEVDAAGAPRIVYAVVLTAGSDAASLTLKTGGASGATLLTLKAAAGESVALQLDCGFACGSGAYVALTGTSPLASVAYA